MLKIYITIQDDIVFLLRASSQVYNQLLIDIVLNLVVVSMLFDKRLPLLAVL